MREIINNFDGEIIRHSTSVALFPAAAADLTSLARSRSGKIDRRSGAAFD